MFLFHNFIYQLLITYAILQDSADESQTPEITTAMSSKFGVGEHVPFNIEDTPNNGKGIEGSGGSSGNGGNGKRTVIDLDEYEDQEHESKRGKNDLVQVKLEPEE